MKLKPCPFCGGRAAFDETPEGGQYVRCRQCDVATALMFPEKCDVRGLLAERWNERTSAPPQAMLDAVRWVVEAWGKPESDYCRSDMDGAVASLRRFLPASRTSPAAGADAAPAAEGASE